MSIMSKYPQIMRFSKKEEERMLGLFVYFVKIFDKNSVKKQKLPDEDDLTERSEWQECATCFSSCSHSKAAQHRSLQSSPCTSNNHNPKMLSGYPDELKVEL